MGTRMVFQMVNLVAVWTVEYLLVGGLLENQRVVDLGEKLRKRQDRMGAGLKLVALALRKEQRTYVMGEQMVEAWEQMNQVTRVGGL